MRRALELARKGWGLTHPNPMVGSVIVEDGRIVAEGYHARDGGPHAERVALAALGRPPKQGATLYVTLEPCSTPGRTGACTEAILTAGIKRVVVGAIDPSPEHCGKGFALLREAGVEVTEGVLGQECGDLNLIFNHWAARGTPLLAAKLGVTLDGRIATRTGQSKWITGEAARTDVHRWRRLFPAIAIGGATVIKDRPALTARPPGEAPWCPWRIVFDGLLTSFTISENVAEIPRLYTDEFRERTIVVTTPYCGRGIARRLSQMGVQVWMFETDSRHAPLAEFRQRCRAAGISGVYIEGGARLISDFILKREIDYLFLYQAPLLLGDPKARPMVDSLRTSRLEDGIRLSEVRRECFGDDGLTRGRVVYPGRIERDEDYREFQRV